MADITPTLRKDIEELAQKFRDLFTPPQFIPGCLVKSVTDVNLYATNNGWIEAVCGQHNQQRVRWKSSETVAVNDYVDVLYFPDRRLFEVYGIGGAGTIVGGGGAPAASQVEVDTGTEAAKYVAPLTFQAGLTARLGDVLRPNPIINGAFQVWQRGTSFAAVASLTYTADRWVYLKIGAMVHTISQSSDVPTVAQADILAPYSLLLDCTTVDAAIAASDACIITHIVEGYNFAGLAQRDFIVSFWAKDTKTGIHCISFQNGGQDRSYVAEFTINTTATWEYKTITVPASPTAGTWDYTNGVGLRISWVLAAGTTFHTTAGAWQTGDFHATANQVNACDNTANDFRLALVEVRPGAVATPFVMPDIEGEVSRCQRYYWKTFPYATAPAQNAGTTGIMRWTATTAGATGQRSPTLLLPVALRTAGTATLYNPSAANAQVRDLVAAADCSAPTITAAEHSFVVNCTGNAATAVGNALAFHATIDAEL